MSYQKTDWINGTTPIDEVNLNKIENQLEKLSDSIVVTTIGEDLNNYTESGIYYFDGNHTPTNIPTGVNGWLQVMSSSVTTNVKQIWYRHGTINSNDYQTFVRTKTGSGWSTWQQFQMVDKIGGVSLLYNNEITTGTAVTLSESLANFRFVAFRLAGGRNYILCPICLGWSGFRGVSSYSRIGTNGNFELLAVRGSFSGTSLTIDDAGQLQLTPSAVITQNALTVSEVWGIR